MAKDLEKTLSDKIEDTIEGVLRFAVRFARTVAVILATPWKCDRILLEADRRDKRFVRPLTFLAIGGFVFSVTISVYPKGLLGLINIIWFSDEISAVILSRWQEALSVTGLLIAAFPVLLTVTSVAALAGQTFRSEKRRSEFLSLNCYLFGYQYFLFFSFFFFAILQGILGELVGVEVKEVLGFEKLTFNDTLFAVLVAALVVLFLSALLMPTVGLCLWGGADRALPCHLAESCGVPLDCALRLRGAGTVLIHGERARGVQACCRAKARRDQDPPPGRPGGEDSRRPIRRRQVGTLRAAHRDREYSHRPSHRTP